MNVQLDHLRKKWHEEKKNLSKLIEEEIGFDLENPFYTYHDAQRQLKNKRIRSLQRNIQTQIETTERYNH